MKTVTTWKEYKKEALKDPKFKKAYDALEPEFKLASSLIQARIDKKLTQQQLAKKAGVSQTIIARLESADSNPTVASVSRVASVLGKELKLVGSNSR
jgi:DNA-binding XRE family transcriptional regulator